MGLSCPCYAGTRGGYSEHMMRVITGSARGRRLTTLQGADIIRPTAESVKEAMFSILQFELEGSRVLDLFAGSGQLGIEALSRGAGSCTFVEQNRQALEVLKSNLEHCGLEQQAYVVNTDAILFLKQEHRFDIALLDPPYGKGLLQQALPLLAAHMSSGGLILCESDWQEELPEEVEGWLAQKTYRYGKTKLTLYRKAEPA